MIDGHIQEKKGSKSPENGFKGGQIWSKKALWEAENKVSGLKMLVNGEIASGFIGKRPSLRARLEEAAAARGDNLSCSKGAKKPDLIEFERDNLKISLKYFG